MSNRNTQTGDLLSQPQVNTTGASSTTRRSNNGHRHLRMPLINFQGFRRGQENGSNTRPRNLSSNGAADAANFITTGSRRDNNNSTSNNLNGNESEFSQEVSSITRAPRGRVNLPSPRDSPISETRSTGFSAASSLLNRLRNATANNSRAQESRSSQIPEISASVSESTSGPAIERPVPRAPQVSNIPRSASANNRYTRSISSGRLSNIASNNSVATLTHQAQAQALLQLRDYFLNSYNSRLNATSGQSDRPLTPQNFGRHVGFDEDDEDDFDDMAPDSGSYDDDNIEESSFIEYEPRHNALRHFDERRFRNNMHRRIRNHAIFSGNINAQEVAPSANPFRYKIVCRLNCRFCDRLLCVRAMKAILLADTKVELFSTDAPPSSDVALINDDYATDNCQCRIHDIACLGCGNVVGYHVTQPCHKCLESCNNGHFWMFHIDGVVPSDRMDDRPSGLTGEKKPMLWAYLPPSDEDLGLNKRMGLIPACSR